MNPVVIVLCDKIYVIYILQVNVWDVNLVIYVYNTKFDGVEL